MDNIQDINANDLIIEKEVDGKSMRKYYANVMWRLFVTFIAMSVVQVIFILSFMGIAYLIAYIIKTEPKTTAIQGYATYLGIAVGDLFGVLIFWLLTMKCDKTKIQQPQKLTFGKWLWMFLCTYGVLGIGMTIGNILSTLLYLPINVLEVLKNQGYLGAINKVFGYAVGGNTASQIMSIDNSWGYVLLGVLVVGILAPIFEELIFRKFLIDNMSKYGVAAAILISAALFGLYHGNLSQFFYTLLMGIVWGAVYAYTGKVILTILLHMSVNLYSSGIIMILYNAVDIKVFDEISNIGTLATEGLISEEVMFSRLGSVITSNPVTLIAFCLYLVAMLIYLTIQFIGLVALIIFMVKHIRNRRALVKGESGSIKSVFINWGSILAIVFCLGLFALTFLSNVVQGLVTLLT